MIIDHKRLIRADPNSPHVTHHVAENGQVHDHHPRLCSNTKCRQWGSELMQDSTVTDKLLAHDSPVWTKPEDTDEHYDWMSYAMYAFSVLVVVLIAFGAFWVWYKS